MYTILKNAGLFPFWIISRYSDKETTTSTPIITWNIVILPSFMVDC